MSNLPNALREVWRRARYVLSRYTLDRCSENAAALTYMSLFALVPLLTVLFAIATAIPTFHGAEAQIQTFLFKHLMPESSIEIQQYLREFSDQAKSLTGPGIAFLVVTAVLMLRNVEKAFNQIWRTSRHRSPIGSFLLYWAVLTLAPVSIGLALGMGTYVSSFAQFIDGYDPLGVRHLLLRVAPLLLSTAGFGLLYLAVPYCQVPFRHALIGGFAAAIAFEFARSVFTGLMVGSSITFIYGAFAAVPLFLLWIYVSWNIVLMGGILTHSLSSYESSHAASRPRVLKALDLLFLFWRRQQTGGTVSEREILRGDPPAYRGLDSESWGRLRDTLLAHRVISETDKGHFVLSRDLQAVPYWQLKEWVNDERPVESHEPADGPAWRQDAWKLLQGQNQGQRETLDISVGELFAR